MNNTSPSLASPSTDAPPALDVNAALAGLSAERRGLLQKIYVALNQATTLEEAFPGVDKEMLAFLGAERLTLYQNARNGREIVSRYKTGGDSGEIRVPLSPGSIAGFVAMTQRSLRIADAYDSATLKEFHSQLRFDERHDQRSGYHTAAVLTVPIRLGKAPLGVLQILNRMGGAGTFTEQDLAFAQAFAQIIGQRFRDDFQGVKGPFDGLVQKGLVKPEQLQELQETAAKRRVSLTALLQHELKIPVEEIGSSLERYYLTPFVRFDPALELPPEFMKHLNKSYLRKQRWVPIGGNRDEAVVLIDDPTDSVRLLDMQRALNARRYVLRVGLPEDIELYLKEGSGGGGGGSGGAEGSLNELLGEMNSEVESLDSVVDEESGMDEKAPLIIKL
ncbi:MAG: GAF domain-containing protein, partial [Magnetococcales bacterium]|nr:GAF domain-containing protein [Magnetococcales bacterium]